MAKTAKQQLKTWFQNLKKPTQEQFWHWLDSYWHKDEKIPQNAIEDWDEFLNSLPNDGELKNYLLRDGANINAENREVLRAKLGVRDLPPNLGLVDAKEEGNVFTKAQVEDLIQIKADEISNNLLKQGTLSNNQFQDESGGLIEVNQDALYIDIKTNLIYRYDGTEYFSLNQTQSKYFKKTVSTDTTLSALKAEAVGADPDNAKFHDYEILLVIGTNNINLDIDVDGYYSIVLTRLGTGAVNILSASSNFTLGGREKSMALIRSVGVQKLITTSIY